MILLKEQFVAFPPTIWLCRDTEHAIAHARYRLETTRQNLEGDFQTLLSGRPVSTLSRKSGIQNGELELIEPIQIEPGEEAHNWAVECFAPFPDLKDPKWEYYLQGQNILFPDPGWTLCLDMSSALEFINQQCYDLRVQLERAGEQNHRREWPWLESPNSWTNALHIGGGEMNDIHLLAARWQMHPVILAPERSQTL